MSVSRIQICVLVRLTLFQVVSIAFVVLFLLKVKFLLQITHRLNIFQRLEGEGQLNSQSDRKGEK